MGISACIISKDEESNIDRCLKSLVSAVDEIIVVDTGSLDNTKTIAKKYGAKVYEFNWNDNFSEARNYSLDKATQEWALIIDCDEELSQDSINLLKDLSTNKEFEAFGVIVSNIIGGFEAYTVQSLRFVKNKPEYRFHELIHEQIGDVISKVKGPYSILSSKIKLIHYGYEEDPLLERKKTERNLRILNKVEVKNRDSLYYLHLGNEYVRLNDFKTAKKLYLESNRLGNSTTPHYTQLCHKIIDVMVKSKEFSEGLAFSENILNEFPDFKAMIFLNAICNIECKNYDQALIRLIQFKQIGSSLSKYPNVDYETQNDIDGLIEQLKRITSNK